MSDTDLDRPLNGHETAAELGLTYRQVNYWSTITPLVNNPGSGTHNKTFRFTPEMLDILCVMGRLIKWGVGVQDAYEIATTDTQDATVVTVHNIKPLDWEIGLNLSESRSCVVVWLHREPNKED